MCAKYTTASNELIKAPIYLFTTTAASITMMAALTHHPPMLLLLLLPRCASQLHSTALCNWPPPASLLFLLSHCLCVFALSDVRLSSHPKQLPLILSAFFRCSRSTFSHAAADPLSLPLPLLLSLSLPLPLLLPGNWWITGDLICRLLTYSARHVPRVAFN